MGCVLTRADCTNTNRAGTKNPLTAGALYEETCTQFGMYNEGDWGCKHPVPAPNGASSNTYIRFHWTGALELSLMILDHFDATGDVSDLQKYLPMAVGVVEAYRQRFPHKDAHGKIDMWPAQALETYQCHDPTSRANCPSNPSTDIGGLMSVLPKLIALPDSAGVTAAQRTAWKAHLAALPPLPVGPAAKKGGASAQKIMPIATGDGFPTSGSGQRSNSENTEMYVAHPFRLFGVGKTGGGLDISLAQQAYAERHSPCNDGWCQDIIQVRITAVAQSTHMPVRLGLSLIRADRADCPPCAQAAMLNMTQDAASQLVARATASNHGGYRFVGFAGHYQVRVVMIIMIHLPSPAPCWASPRRLPSPAGRLPCLALPPSIGFTQRTHAMDARRAGLRAVARPLWLHAHGAGLHAPRAPRRREARDAALPHLPYGTVGRTLQAPRAQEYDDRGKLPGREAGVPDCHAAESLGGHDRAQLPED